MAIKVSQSVIDEIKKKGMGQAIAHANSGKASAEFVEGAKRFYGNRVGGSTPSKPAGGKPIEEKESAPKEVKMPSSAPAVANRRIVGKADVAKDTRPASRLVGAIQRGSKTGHGGLTGGQAPFGRLVGKIQEAKKPKGKMSEAALRKEGAAKGIKGGNALGGYVSEQRKKGR